MEENGHQQRFTEYLNPQDSSPQHPYQTYWSTTTQPGSPDIDHSQQYTAPKDRPLSPSTLQHSDIGSPGLESVVSGEHDKEVYYGGMYQEPPPPPPPAQKRMCGLPKAWFLFAAGLATCVVIGVAVALGVVFGTRHSTPHPATTTSPTPTSTSSSTTSSLPSNTGNPDFSTGGEVNELYYSKTGAWNGSGIALASQTFGTSANASVVIYFQHHSGDLRWMQLMPDGSWTGGEVGETVVSDARNNTPISAVSWAQNGVENWHIFYVDKNNTVTQKLTTNVSRVWQDGPLNALGLKAADTPAVGLQACWFGNYYGDTQFPQTQWANQTVITPDIGMHLFYGSSESTIEQYGWISGTTSWLPQGTWLNKNGQAGIGCYSWGPTTVGYVMMLDMSNTLNIYWKDTNTSRVSNESHPINQWTNTTIAVPNLHPSSSLGFTNFLYCQMANEMINGYSIWWDAENTHFITTENFEVEGDPGIPGTHLTVSALAGDSGGAYLLVFYQTEGNDISMYSRDLYGGQWTEKSLTIPNT